jgi:hypothetical protein
MCSIKLSNGPLQTLLTREAWIELFSNYAWTEPMLEKYQDKVDWDKISGNKCIHWTIPMIRKFQSRINWNIFSEIIKYELLTEELLEEFQDKWNWDELSCNQFNYIKNADKLLMKFADKWSWHKIINSVWGKLLFENKGIEFYEKYKDYIHEFEIFDTYLWEEMLSQVKKQLITEITTEDNDKRI